MWRLTDDHAVIYTNDRATLKALFAYSRFPHHDLSRATTYEGKNGRVFAWQFTFPISAWNGVVRYLGRASITMLDQERTGTSSTPTPEPSAATVVPAPRRGSKKNAMQADSVQPKSAEATGSSGKRTRNKIDKPTADLSQPLQPMGQKSAGPSTRKARSTSVRPIQEKPATVADAAPTVAAAKKVTTASSSAPSVEPSSLPSDSPSRGKSRRTSAATPVTDPVRIVGSLDAVDGRSPRSRKRDGTGASTAPSPSPIPVPVPATVPEGVPPRKRPARAIPPAASSPELPPAASATEDKPARKKRTPGTEPLLTPVDSSSAKVSEAEPVAVTPGRTTVDTSRKKGSRTPGALELLPPRSGVRKRSNGNAAGRAGSNDAVPEKAAPPVVQMALPELTPAKITNGRSKVKATGVAENAPEVVTVTPAPVRPARGRKAVATPVVPVLVAGGGTRATVKPPKAMASVGLVQEPPVSAPARKRAVKR